MSLPREPFSWDADDDLPVPLGPSASDHSTPGVSTQVLTEAEMAVCDAPEALARQDTDPAATIPTSSSEASTQRSWRSRQGGRWLNMTISRRALGATVAITSALAFAHGWSVGASVAERSLRFL